MELKVHVWLLVMALFCSMTACRSFCKRSNCTRRLKVGGKIRVTPVGNFTGGLQHVIMQLPRRSTKLLRTTGGSIYIRRRKSSECHSSDIERNFVCPDSLSETRTCGDVELPCDLYDQITTTTSTPTMIVGSSNATAVNVSVTIPPGYSESSTEQDVAAQATTQTGDVPDDFVTVIVIVICCVVFSVLFISISFCSFMIYRNVREKRRQNKARYEDGSVYLALEKKHSPTSDRYMDLNIKDQGSRKLPSVSSVSKIQVENGETNVNYSGFIEAGEDAMASTDDLISLGKSVDTFVGNGKPQMISADLTRESSEIATGQWRTGSELENKPAVQRAVERFKAGSVPQLYNTKIYDQASEARLMKSKVLKTNSSSPEQNVFTKGGIGQSYDKVIVTDVSPEMRAGNTDSYIDPDEMSYEKNAKDSKSSRSLKGNRGDNQRASYIEVDDSDKSSNTRDLRSSYLSLDDEAMSRDEQTTIYPFKPSYIELDEDAMKTDKDSFKTTNRTSYIELDEQAMADGQSNNPAASVKAPYIELDEKAMTEDKDKLPTQSSGPYFEIGGQTVKKKKGDSTYSSKAAYIEVDELGMAEGKDETLASSRVSYFEVDDQGIKRKKGGSSITSKAYIEVDERTMKTEALSEQNPRASYLSIEENGIKRNRDATISSKSSYIELDDHAMTQDAKLAGLRAPYMELNKDGITSHKGKSSGYKELHKIRLPSGKVKSKVAGRVKGYETAIAQRHDNPSGVKVDEIYDERKRQYFARRTYEDKIVEQKLPNTGNPIKRHQQSVKYEECVPSGPEGEGDDMYDENVVDEYSRKKSALRGRRLADHNQRSSSRDGSLFSNSNVNYGKDNEGIYFHADDADETSSYEKESTITPKQEESLYDETSEPKAMQGESQSIYEEIPAERAAFQTQKQASILHGFKTKVGWSGALRSAKRSPLPAIPATNGTNTSTPSFEPILEGQGDDTYEVLPGEKVMGQKPN